MARIDKETTIKDWLTVHTG